MEVVINRWATFMLILSCGFSGNLLGLEILPQQVLYDSVSGNYSIDIGYESSNDESPPHSFSIRLAYDSELLSLSDIAVSDSFNADGFGGTAVIISQPGELQISGWRVDGTSLDDSSLFSFTAELLADVSSSILVNGSGPNGFEGFISADNCTPLDAVFPPPILLRAFGSISGFVWEDMANTGNIDDSNLMNLGLDGVRIELCDAASTTSVDSVVTYSMTGNLGFFAFPEVPEGSYILKLDESSISDRLSLRSTPTEYTVTVIGGENVERNFGVMAEPTSILLQSAIASISDHQVVIEWAVSSDEKTLGYEISQLTSNGVESIKDGFIFTETSAGAYKFIIPNKTSGIFLLHQIQYDLSSSRLAVLIPERSAAPVGEPTVVMSPDHLSKELIIPDHAASVLLLVDASWKPLLDTTNAYEPQRLRPEVITDHNQDSSALYFSSGSGRVLRLQEPVEYADELLAR